MRIPKLFGILDKLNLLYLIQLPLNYSLIKFLPFQKMEHYIKQNNVFNIYEDYFTDAPNL